MPPLSPPPHAPRHARLGLTLHSRRAASALALACLAAVTQPVSAGPVAERQRSSGELRVCIWPDYYGITYRNPRTEQLVGIDIDLSAEFAKSLGLKLQYLESSFAKLVDHLLEDRCDIAMHAVGVTPQRQKVLRFSQPYLQSDIYGITTRSNHVVRRWEDIDRPGVRVAVQAGTFMEPVMTEALKQAQMVIIRPPKTREQELEAGRVDVFMTDFPYSRRLLDNADWARLVAPPRPFHTIPYAYAVKPGDDDWLRQVDQFVAQIKRDGRLETAARRHGLGEIVVK
ncbi:ABC transporter substrate-binding protein [Ideonella sp. DXS22W]|uniref:ABC transporter substrate-binding protein n=2 Tax=Pseudaquabacterium inlustre TaxID=2984192 RepID=A0ABU9CIX6_9BURK